MNTVFKIYISVIKKKKNPTMACRVYPNHKKYITFYLVKLCISKKSENERPFANGHNQ